ncbi:hypothetical protein ACFSQ7_21245 [Paenibacillus rhizoplanae]
MTIDNQEIHVSSAFPYSGETDTNGVTGEFVYTKPGKYEEAKGKIAVVEIKNFKNFPMALVMNIREKKLGRRAVFLQMRAIWSLPQL